MRTAFFTFGSGAGNLMIGAALYNGLKRAGIRTEFTAITDCEFSKHFTSCLGPGFNVRNIRREPEKLFRDDLNTELFSVLEEISPDLILVYKVWLPIMPLIGEFKCPKILLLRQCPELWMHIRTGEHDFIHINTGDYDAALSIEPGFLPEGFSSVPPLVLKNRDELPSKAEAREALEIEEGKKCCIIAQNGRPGEFERILAESSGTGDLSDYRMIYTSNRDTKALSLFPLIDYLPAADFIIAGAGYNLFYESRYLNIPGRFFSFKRDAENPQWRIDNNSGCTFTENGADTIAGIVQAL